MASNINRSFRKFSPPYGDRTREVQTMKKIIVFSPPYGDSIMTAVRLIKGD